MKNKGATASPRMLQNIAFIAVILFGLLMASAIHITQKTVEEVRAHQIKTGAVVIGSPITGTTTTTSR